MNLLLLTPAPAGSLSGNRATAERWAELMRQSGHQVILGTNYDPQQADACDGLVALHAWRSREAVANWREHQPGKPVIIALTGTDLYRFQFSRPDETLPAMEQADRLIVLHRLAWRDVPHRLQHRVSVVLQSAARPGRQAERAGVNFDVCVVGHLREEKDPLRSALAARKLPPASAVRVLQAGRAHSDDWARDARREMAENPRYQWLGELDREGTSRLMADSRLMVISSLMEGGANVVSEACRAGLPVVASDIPGNRGLLGEQYPGLFPVGDETALAELLARAENDADWLNSLAAITGGLAEDFTPERERASLEAAIAAAFSPAG